MDDRSIQIALLQAIGALTEQLTGNALTLSVNDEHGKVFFIRLDGETATWTKVHPAASSDPEVSQAAS